MKRAPEGGLEGSRTRHQTTAQPAVRRSVSRLIAILVAGVVVAGGPAAAIAVGQTSTPSPKELWDSYPLEGTRPDPAPTPTTAATASPTATPTPAEGAPAAEGDHGASTTLIIGGVMVAFAIGIGASEMLRRRRRTATLPVLRERPAPRPPEPEPQPTVAARPAAAKPAPAAKPRAAKPRAAKRPTAAKAPAAVPDAQPAGEWLEPEPPAPAPTRRFVSTWPDDADQRWTCEIDWKAGYRSSSFRAMAAPPGVTKRRAFGESSAGRWTLMADPEPPTPELVDCVRDLSGALEAAGWQEAGRGRRWYALRFIWTHTEDPRPLEPLTRKAKHV